MSFSSQVKEELSQKVPAARHCQLAELAGILLFDMKVSSGVSASESIPEKKNGIRLQIKAENEGTIRKCFTILQKAFKIEENFNVVYDKQSIMIADGELIRRILQAVKMWDENSGYMERGFADARLLSMDCCRRAFIRGCFLSAGSVSTPEKFYHFEIVCGREILAEQIREILGLFQIEARIVLRKQYYVVYIKDGDQISNLLGFMEAPRAVMDFENVRILKDVRNQVNRKFNCEMANLSKTASAAAQQLAAIVYLRDAVGLESLPEGLEAVAKARLEMPEASLSELGAGLEPPVGKSGVNHRLRKIKALADQHKLKQHSD